MEMQREFRGRDELSQYLRQQFPEAQGELSEIRGGRAAAQERLNAFRPARYAATRNFLNGAVSHLSPYLRHGVLTLREVLDAVRNCSDGRVGEKFVQELAWRDFWQRVYWKVGNGIWEDQEEPKVPQAKRQPLPEDLGNTDLACMDSMARDLEESGYLHNHARMWMAAYIVHWRRTAWQEGARWFLRHLLDGDPASNNLSWQWVASTFSAKPYIFNRENLEHYTDGEYCRRCNVRNHCPFDKAYSELSEELFGREVLD